MVESNPDWFWKNKESKKQKEQPIVKIGLLGFDMDGKTEFIQVYENQVPYIKAAVQKIVDNDNAYPKRTTSISR